MKKAMAFLLMTGFLLTGCGSQTITESENFVIDADKVTTSASFYPITINGTQMEVLAIRDSAGNVRTAFNTCQSCYTSGNGRYKADGTELVCQNCGFHFTAEQVGTPSQGGCNPWPITDEDKSVTGEKIEISYDFLKNSKDIFANW